MRHKRFIGELGCRGGLSDSTAAATAESEPGMQIFRHASGGSGYSLSLAIASKLNPPSACAWIRLLRGELFSAIWIINIGNAICKVQEAKRNWTRDCGGSKLEKVRVQVDLKY